MMDCIPMAHQLKDPSSMKHSLLSFNGIATQKNQTQKSKIVRDLYPFLLFWWVAFLRLDSHWTPVEFQTFPKKGLVSASHKPSSTGKNAQQSPGVHSTSPGSCSVGVFLGRNIWILNQKKKETQGSNVWIIHDSFGVTLVTAIKVRLHFSVAAG